MNMKIAGFFVQQKRRAYSLQRRAKNQQRQAIYDRLWLTLSGWPHFYFNYVFAASFDSHIAALCQIRDAQEFRQSLLQLFELHYLSALMSFNASGLMLNDIQQQHFSDMQYGYQCLTEAASDSASGIINNTLHEMLYYDVTYSWSSQPLFGPFSSYYSARALLYQVKRELDKKADLI
ncbi:MAG: hypothetical protein OEY29_11760 [Gammaproteobacteria bacterium]|nr:hypothetical protein [Gammaproteobacteria bacterium]